MGGSVAYNGGAMTDAALALLRARKLERHAPLPPVSPSASMRELLRKRLRLVAVAPAVVPSPRDRLLERLRTRLTAPPPADFEAAAFTRTAKRRRAPSEARRLAGQRLREWEERIVGDIEAWRPELVPIWPRIRQDVFAVVRRAKQRHGSPTGFAAWISPLEAVQHYVHENEERVAELLAERGDEQPDEAYAAHIELLKRVARARGEDVSSSDFRVEPQQRRRGRDRWEIPQWMLDAPPGSVALPAS